MTEVKRTRKRKGEKRRRGGEIRKGEGEGGIQWELWPYVRFCARSKKSMSTNTEQATLSCSVSRVQLSSGSYQVSYSPAYPSVSSWWGTRGSYSWNASPRFVNLLLSFLWFRDIMDCNTCPALRWNAPALEHGERESSEEVGIPEYVCGGWGWGESEERWWGKGRQE